MTLVDRNLSGEIVRQMTPEDAELLRKRDELASIRSALAEHELELADLRIQIVAFEGRYLENTSSARQREGVWEPTVRLAVCCLKLIADFAISCFKKPSIRTGARLGRDIGMRSAAASLLIAVGMFAGSNALAATTYTVTTLADATGSCTGASCTTLRAAIMEANSASGNTINFTGLSGIITLTSALPAITQSMTVAGPGAGNLAISGNNAYQIFNINNSSATVAISGLTLANGIVTGSEGGAINNMGTLTVTNSTFAGNSASSGGAIYNGGTLTVGNSTLSGNSTPGAGGAIFNFGSTNVTNSTFAGNSAGQAGGAISNGNGKTLGVFNSILTGNTASSAVGAGIENGGGTANAGYNLYYQNFDSGRVEDDCYSCMTNTNAITGSNPNLLPLGYYGGPTQTMLPQPGSPVICAGSYADVPNGVTTDQRGFPLTSSTCSNGGVDVGAVQTDYVQVITTADSGAGSLRAAITVANSTSYGGDIDFAPTVTGTITLASSLPRITQSIAIMGPGAGALTISGNNAYQIFYISSGALTISGLTLANGYNALDDGGAIVNNSGTNSGTLTVTNSTFSNNSSVYSGGGGGGAIGNYYGTLTVTNSTFSGNSAGNSTKTSGAGGAISNLGTLTVTGSTFSGNSSSGFGGAILAFGGTQTVTNCTFSGNSATSAYGGAILGESGTLTVTNSTFSGNSSGGWGGGILAYNGTTLIADNNIFTGNSAGSPGGAGIQGVTPDTINASHNLYYQNLDAGTTEDDCNGCTSNTNAITGSNPLLAALGSYGGAMQTMLPQPGSPAICSGSTALIPSGITTDQRDFSRTSTYDGTACVDLGAVQTDYTAVAFSSSSYSGFVSQAVNPVPMVTVTENGQNIGGVSITLGYSGTGSPAGLGPVTTVGGAGATFSSLGASSVAQGALSVNLPITASGNSVQPATLTASASLNIHSTTQTITFVAPAPVTYGSSPVTLTGTGGASGNPVTFSLDPTTTLGAATLSGSTLTITGVGIVVIDANQTAGGGYSAAAQVQQNTIVSPALLTITASSPTVTYGSSVPTITPIFGVFFNGDTSAVVTRQPTCVTAYTTTSAVGSSPSTSCSGAAAANYAFTYINGSVTVNPVPTFAISGVSGSISIAPGAATGNTVPITITPSNGFTGTVALTCSITPVAASNPPTCNLSPNSVTMTGTGAQNSTLTIMTTMATTAENQLRKLLWPLAGTALALVLPITVPRQRRGWLIVLGVLALSITGGAIGCGGSGGSESSGGSSGTTPGTYIINVTGTSGNFTGTAASFTLTVQ
jgi:predicted outer membrane repeat protein